MDKKTTWSPIETPKNLGAKIWQKQPALIWINGLLGVILGTFGRQMSVLKKNFRIRFSQIFRVKF